MFQKHWSRTGSVGMFPSICNDSVSDTMVGSGSVGIFPTIVSDTESLPMVGKFPQTLVQYRHKAEKELKNVSFLDRVGKMYVFWSELKSYRF